MALKVSVDKKHLPKGTPLEVAGLGLIENGGSSTLTEEQELDYFLRNGQTVKDGLKDSEEFKVEGTAELKDTPDLSTVSDTYTPAAEEEAVEEKKEVKS